MAQSKELYMSIHDKIEEEAEEGYIIGYMETVKLDGKEVVISEHMTYNQYLEAVGVQNDTRYNWSGYNQTIKDY